jgi:hypothetical protein
MIIPSFIVQKIPLCHQNTVKYRRGCGGWWAMIFMKWRAGTRGTSSVWLAANDYILGILN